MFTASQKKKENIAEYLLYMWQVEDMIRANNMDLDQIEESIICRYTSLTEQQRYALTEWYESLIDMMRRENVQQNGHLQINRNTLADISELHKRLLANDRFDAYSREYYNTLPFIVELRAKSGANIVDEIETRFNALYGILLLRLQQREVSSRTLQATGQISRLLAMLSHYYNEEQQGTLFRADSDS